jgi:hypothetical protein
MAKFLKTLNLDPFSNVSNIAEVREGLKAYCLAELQDIALSIESLELEEIAVLPDVPSPLEDYLEENDPRGFKAKAYEAVLRCNREELKTRKIQNGKLFGIIYGILSEDSKQRLIGEDFNKCEKKLDGFNLWKLVHKVHTSGTPNESDGMRRHRINQIYYECRQRPNEPLTSYLINFKDAIRGFNNIGEIPPPLSDQAIKFLHGLSINHAEFISTTLNNISMGTTPPASPDAIVILATNYRPVMGQLKGAAANNAVMYAEKSTNPQTPTENPRRLAKIPQQNTPKLFCRYCKKKNHVIEDCRALKATMLYPNL